MYDPPVVSVSELTYLIMYIYHWNIQILYNIIIIKTKVHLRKAQVTLYILCRAFVFIAVKHF